MQVFKNLVLSILSLVAPTIALGADLGATTLPMTGQLMLKRGEVSTTTRVEYCLRNVPELTESLIAAHANYSRALVEAAEILDRDFPATKFTFQRFRVQKSLQTAAADDLRRAHSEGFDRVCPSIILYMQRATGRSLAKEVGDLLLRAQERFGP